MFTFTPAWSGVVDGSDAAGVGAGGEAVAVAGFGFDTSGAEGYRCAFGGSKAYSDTAATPTSR